MKRFHVHVGVSDMERSIAFYSGLFGTRPNVIKPDYAKWMLDDPHVNFAISQKCGAAKGIEHIGIEAANESELVEVFGRLKDAGMPVLDEGTVNCCYAQSDKNWIADPDGVIWEAFHTHGQTTTYGDKLDHPALAGQDAVTDDACPFAVAATKSAPTLRA